MTRDILRQTSGTFRKVNNKISGALTANEENKNNGSKSWMERIHQRKESKRVNFVDVELLPGQVESSDPVDDGVELSVRSVHVESFNDCIRILDSLNLRDRYCESEYVSFFLLSLNIFRFNFIKAKPRVAIFLKTEILTYNIILHHHPPPSLL